MKSPPAWVRRGRTYERARQFGMKCGRCGLWGWARRLQGDTWWCHVQPDGFVHEGNDCPNCGAASSADESNTYEREAMAMIGVALLGGGRRRKGLGS